MNQSKSAKAITPEWINEFKRRFGLTVQPRDPESREEIVLKAWALTNPKIEDFISQTLQELLKEVEEMIGEDNFGSNEGPQWCNDLREEQRLKLEDIKRRWIK